MKSSLQITRKPNLYLLGAAYGLGWAIVTMFTEAWMTGSFVTFQHILSYAFHLVFALIPTVILTRLSGGWLARRTAWTIVPCGLLLLMVAINMMALSFLLFAGGLEALNYMAYVGMILMTVVPIVGRDLHWVIMALAILNCWDLRRRMMPSSACSQP
ncbi:MAG: hypothetical protein RL444_1293 [Verrucomicrobiota bacterium]|jgi:hypothetical protein